LHFATHGLLAGEREVILEGQRQAGAHSVFLQRDLRVLTRSRNFSVCQNSRRDKIVQWETNDA
jgi:hypothetical protein